MEFETNKPKNSRDLKAPEASVAEKLKGIKTHTEIAQERFQQFLDLVEKTNQEMVKREKLPVVSQQEETDIKVDSNQKKWHLYWAKRLAPEIDILPEPIGNIVKRINNGEITNEENSELSKYVSKRQAVLKFNIEKRLEMAKLKQRLQDIDKKEDYPEEEAQSRRKVFYNESKNELFILEDNQERKITYGDIVADYDWGVKYQPDKSMPEKIWRKIRKLSDITEARHNVEKIFNEELARIEGVSLPTTSWTLELLKKHPEAGVIAEKMIKNFLTRIQYNNPELNFAVESSNALEDAELKYDFKIIIPQKRRGVAIEGENLPREEYAAAKKRIGVQFTISHKQKALEHKMAQIGAAKEKIGEKEYTEFVKKPVDDIVLLTLPLETYNKRFSKWLNTKQPSGGPEWYLNHEEKSKILKEIFHNFLELSDEEIKKL